MNNNTLTVKGSGFRLTFKNNMTYQFASEIEDMILDAMRHYEHVEVDLSNVQEIDLCGVHLLGFLERFSDKGVLIVARSAAVKQAYEHFLSRTAALAKVQTMSTARVKKTNPMQSRFVAHQEQCAA